MKLKKIDLFKTILNNRSIFIGIDNELDLLLKKLPQTCSNCLYKRSEPSFNNILANNKTSILEKCNIIFNQKIEIE